MLLLMVADQQNAPQVFSYAKKLARHLDKAGQKVVCYGDRLADIEAVLDELKPNMVHLHYHPMAKKIRHVMRVCEERDIPVVMSFHAVKHVPEERVRHVEKAIQRSREAFFISEVDCNHALTINPRLKDHCHVVRIPPPHDLPEDFLAARHRLVKAFPQEPAVLTVVDSIMPERGLESIVEISRDLPASPSGEPMKMRLVGEVPAGQGKYAKYLKAMIAYHQLPVELLVSKRRIGKKQLCRWLEDTTFAYLPDGVGLLAGGAAGKPVAYGGLTEHHMMVPFLNAAHVLVLGHGGEASSPAMRVQAHLIPYSGAVAKKLVSTMADYQAHPDEYRAKVAEAADYAAGYSWAELAKSSMAAYSQLSS